MVNTREINRYIRALQTLAVPRVRPRILRTFSHDSSAYTQGLLIHDGKLFESTGLENASSLREIDPNNGKVLRQVNVEGDFAEGIGVAENMLYQLMWKSGRVLRYDARTLRCIDVLKINHEGWGIATLGDQLYVSDGSSVLREYDTSMYLSRSITVTASGLPFRHLNALSSANALIYANVWYSPLIVAIDPNNGKLRRVVDCSELWDLEAPKNEHCVMNGIAHDPAKDTLYLTGKYWRNYFEVSVS